MRRSAGPVGRGDALSVVQHRVGGQPVTDELAVFDDMGSLVRLAWLGRLLLLLGLGGIVVLVAAWEFYWVA